MLMGLRPEFSPKASGMILAHPQTLEMDTAREFLSAWEKKDINYDLKNPPIKNKPNRLPLQLQ